MADEYTVVIDLLRHGEPEGGQCLRGSTDHALTEKGWEQAKTATRSNLGWNRIISSPLQRCLAFAQYYSNQSNLPLTILESWQEIDFGLWDGKTYAELHDSDTDALSAFWEDPYRNTPPEGEAFKAFTERVHQAWNVLLAEAKGEHVLLVTHGGVIRQVLAKVLDIPETSIASITRMHIPYACRCRIEVYVDKNGKHWPRLMFPGIHPENNNL